MINPAKSTLFAPSNSIFKLKNPKLSSSKVYAAAPHVLKPTVHEIKLKNSFGRG